MATYIASDSPGEVFKLGDSCLLCTGQSAWWLPSSYRAVRVKSQSLLRPIYIVSDSLSEDFDRGLSTLYRAVWLTTTYIVSSCLGEVAEFVDAAGGAVGV